MNDRVKSPCFNCPDRKENGICHSDCEKYLDYLDEKEADTAKFKAWQKAYQYGTIRSGMSDKKFKGQCRKTKNKVFKDHKK